MAGIMGRFGWMLHLLDIIIVSILIYRFLLLLKGVGMAIRVMLCLAAAFLLYLLATFFGLESLSWLLNGFLSFSLLILAIIFQHDIRRALVSFSHENSGNHYSQIDSGGLIDELDEAVQSLSSRKIGALIVIERSSSLDNFLVVGTEIDAKVTSELITSIFLPYSPIHDGAVIIQGDKLTKAGCFLPLSQSPELDKSFGTRHRAAVGLTEMVDAAVIVVSEETGRVALATNSGIWENIEFAALRKELKKLMESGHGK